MQKKKEYKKPIFGGKSCEQKNYWSSKSIVTLALPSNKLGPVVDRGGL